MSSSITTVRIDTELKAEAQAVFKELGLTFSAGVSAFLKAVVREKGMPFEMKIDNPDSRVSRNNGKMLLQARQHGGNSSLNRAGTAKKDEFYTQLSDIEVELENYTTSFLGKTVFCNCDDPFESNFFRYFASHFDELGLKKLIATCYSSSSLMGSSVPVDGVFNEEMAQGKAYKAVVTSIKNCGFDVDNESLDIERLFASPGNSIERLDGDGDFRSAECVSLLNEADVVVTNPPFSLFRDYMEMLVANEKKFIIIGNINAVTYKEIFPLIRDNKVWLGASIHSGDRKFYVPDSYPLNAAGCGIDENGRRYIKVKGVRWFTNLDMSQRHQGLTLSKAYDPAVYPVYDNYSAINVSRTADIPYDYPGVMGVPITFLDKYDPEQFEILMLANGNVRANSDPETLRLVGYKRHENDKGGVGIIAGKRSYARILIRNRHPKSNLSDNSVERKTNEGK